MSQVTERSIAIEHGDEGSSVAIEDPTTLEYLSLLTIAVTLLGGLWIWRRKR